MARQQLSHLRDKMYLSVLENHGRCTVKEVNGIMGGTAAGTLNSLKRLMTAGTIHGERDGVKMWVFWCEK